MRLVNRNVLLSVFLTLGLTSCSGGPDKTSAQAILDAVAALDARKPAVAIIELKNAIQAHPKDPYLRAQLAEVFLAIGDGVSAEIEAEKAGGFGFDSSKALLLTARALLRQNGFEKALQLLENAGTLNSKESERQLLLAKTYLAIGRLDAAEAALTRADPQAPETGVAAAKLTAARRDLAGAATALFELLGQYESYAPGWSLLGDIERYRGDNAASLSAYDQAIKFGLDNHIDRWHRALLNIVEDNIDAVLIDVKVLRGRDKEQPQAAFLEGVVKIQQGDYLAAQELLQTTLNKLPNFLPATYFLALTHVQLEEYESAELLLSRYVNALPRNIRARHIRAFNLWKLGQIERAAEEAQAILELDSSDTFALELLSLHSLGRGQLGDALGTLEKLAALGDDGDELGLRLGLGYLMAHQQGKGVAALEKVSESGGEAAIRAEVALILQALQQKDYDRALQLIDKLQQKQPGKARPYLLHGTALAEKGDFAGALKSFEYAWSIAPGEVAAGRSLARIALKQGEIEQAEYFLREVLIKHPGSVVARIELAQLLLVQKDSKSFIKHLETAIQKSPNDPRPWVLLIRYYLATNNAKKALEKLRRIPAVLKDMAGVVEMTGLVYLRTGQPRKAEEIFSVLSQRFTQTAQFRLWLAEAQGAQGKSGEARRTLEIAMSEFSDDLNLKIALANLEVREGNIDKADMLLKGLRAKDDNGAAVVSLRANIALARRDYEGAVDALEQLVATQPSHENVYKLVNAIYAAGETERAIATGEQWIQRDAENVPLLLLLAEFYKHAGERDVAMLRYRAVLNIQPDNSIANNNIAELLMDTDSAEALKHAEIAYEKVPDSVQIADTYGWALHLNGKTEEALIVLERGYEGGAKSNERIRHLTEVRKVLESR